eukprot:TRINITY_DN6688_c0_g1_i2.p1 TRINITY_DN6688_c0_g1~~TRINITY_DN6688_c0_g1_i2.p1  ORF type:complete len:550 (-),score=73.58 TRINITY_DN6688_c0_g1_i2:286-1935(-)
MAAANSKRMRLACLGLGMAMLLAVLWVTSSTPSSPVSTEVTACDPVALVLYNKDEDVRRALLEFLDHTNETTHDGGPRIANLTQSSSHNTTKTTLQPQPSAPQSDLRQANVSEVAGSTDAASSGAAAPAAAASPVPDPITSTNTTAIANTTSPLSNASTSSVRQEERQPLPLKTRLHEFVHRLTSEPVPPEFASIYPRCVHKALPQRPCSDPSGFASSMPPVGFPTLLDAANKDQGLADMHASRISPVNVQAMRDSGLENRPPLYPVSSRCAVVGSAPRILDNTLGDLIDSHDVVIRVNLAPANEKFRSKVGRKRTIEVANSMNIVGKWIPAVRKRLGGANRPKPMSSKTGRNSRTSLFPFSGPELRGLALQEMQAHQAKGGSGVLPAVVPAMRVEVAPESFARTALLPGITAGDVAEILRPIRHRALPSTYRFAAMSPDVRRIGNRIYCHLSENGLMWPHQNSANGGDGIAPTSGFLSILFALSTCSEVSVFGFGQSASHQEWRARASGGGHYFDAPMADDGDNGGHWYTLERFVLHRMAEEGLVKYY